MSVPSHKLREHPGECAIGECVVASSVPAWDLSERMWTWEVRVDDGVGRGYPVATRTFTAGWRFNDGGEKVPIWIRES